ncbi:MAG TPA: hypothetical protein VGM79_04695 [Streptosporangiaceae bacterium]|jgi:hypothetical protein
MAVPPMVIRARVRARLLGLPLLTLDACITAASDGAAGAGLPPAGRPGSPLPGRVIAAAAPPAPGRPPPAAVPGTSVARARELVEQGERVLDQERRQS